MKRRGTWLTLGMVWGLAGCFTTGRDFPAEIDWIKKNATLQKDVQMVLGPPFAVGNSGGVATWTYAFYKYQLWGKSFHKELKLYWHPDRSVKHYSYNSSFPTDGPAPVSPYPPATQDASRSTPSSNTNKPYPSY